MVGGQVYKPRGRDELGPALMLRFWPTPLVSIDDLFNSVLVTSRAGVGFKEISRRSLELVDKEARQVVFSKKTITPPFLGFDPRINRIPEGDWDKKRQIITLKTGLVVFKDEGRAVELTYISPEDEYESDVFQKALDSFERADE